jgi:hypothetical protein
MSQLQDTTREDSQAGWQAYIEALGLAWRSEPECPLQMGRKDEVDTSSGGMPSVRELQHALTLAQGKPLEETLVFISLGVAHWLSGQKKLASSAWQKGCDIAERLGHKRLAAMLQEVMGQAELAMLHPRLANDHFFATFQLYSELRAEVEAYRLIALLACLGGMMGERERSERFYRVLRSHSRQLGDPLQEARTWIIQAESFWSGRMPGWESLGWARYGIELLEPLLPDGGAEVSRMIARGRALLASIEHTYEDYPSIVRLSEEYYLAARDEAAQELHRKQEGARDRKAEIDGLGLMRYDLGREGQAQAQQSLDLIAQLGYSLAALDRYAQALAHLREEQDRLGEAIVAATMALIRLTSAPDKEWGTERLLTLFRVADDPLGQGRVLYNEGMRLCRCEPARLEHAVTYFRCARELLYRADAPQEEQRGARWRIAEIKEQLGSYGYQRAKALGRDLYGRLLDEGGPGDE